MLTMTVSIHVQLSGPLAITPAGVIAKGPDNCTCMLSVNRGMRTWGGVGGLHLPIVLGRTQYNLQMYFMFGMGQGLVRDRTVMYAKK